MIDFGAARYATTSHSRSLTVIIKPGYSPEEQYRSRGEQGPHTDVYALAAVFYRMITGVTPPDALERRAVLENKKKDILEPPSKNCKIDRSIENAILNAMNVQAEDRTETVLAFWNELISTEPVKRRNNKVKTLDLARWPLGLKIGVPVVGIIAVTLLVLLLTGKIGLADTLPTDIVLGDEMTRVPSVINYSIGAAQEMLDNQQLTPVISGRQPSDVIPADLVLTQSISAGQVVKMNTQVELYISAAPEMQVEAGHVPDVLYFSEEDALTQFREQGVEPKVEYEYNDDVAAGLIIRQSVMGGDPLGEDDEIILTVSLGRDPAESENENTADGTTTLKMNRSALSLYVGDAVTLSASGGIGNYRWNSSDTSVVTVESGAVTAAGRGQATITLTSGDEMVTCPVTVREYSLSLNQTQLSLTKGNSVTLSVSGAPSGTEISWSSSNTAVATVQNGQVTAVGAGNATVTAKMTYGGKDYTTTCSVTVTEEVTGSIYLSQSALTLTQGDSDTITATVSPGGQAVAWSSSNASVATVSNGQVTAKAAGTVTITAQMTYGGKSYTDTCTVTVTPLAGSLSISLETLELKVGETESLLTLVSPSGQNVTWNSSNTSVVTVSGGQVTAKAVGTATITAQMTYGGKTYSDSCVVTVAPQPGYLSMYLETLELRVGETSSPGLLAAPSGQTVTWSSSDPSVAAVSNGQVTAKAAGTATITAQMTYNGQTYTDTCVVTVTALPEGSLSVYPETLSLEVGETFGFGYSQSPTDQAVTWSSSNTAVATVNNNQVTAKSAGTTIITAKMTYGGKTYTDTCTVTVVGSSFSLKPLPDMRGGIITEPTPSVEPALRDEGAASISLSRSSMTISMSDITTAEGHVLIANTTPKGQSVSWSSSDPSVATVRQSGFSVNLEDGSTGDIRGAITMVGPGKTIITAGMTYNGKTYTASCEVTVEPAASITLSSSSLKLLSGETTNLTTTTLPGQQIVTWSSSDTSVATIDSGQVSARFPGAATITASITYMGKTYVDTCNLTVLPAVYILRMPFTGSSEMTLAIKETEILYAQTTPLNLPVSWNSSNSEVATVSTNSGSSVLITAKSIGSATITARTSYNGQTSTATYEVTVT